MSSAEVGSSSTTSFGPSTMARAMAIRWRCPAGELMRIAVHGGRVEAGVGQRPRYDFAPLGIGQPALDRESLLDDLGHGQTRRQRPVGVLEDDLKVAAQGPQRRRIEPVDASAEVAHRSFGTDQPEDGEPQRGLAGARLAHHPHGLAFADIERDPVHGLHIADRATQEALLDREPDLQVLGLEDRFRRRIGGGRRAFGLGREQHLRVGMLRVCGRCPRRVRPRRCGPSA